MKKYLKEFLKRGLMFGGFGPIIMAMIYFIIEKTAGLTLNGGEAFVAVISTYLLAFVQAGASVFNQIEHWPITKSLACHFVTLFVAYTACYLLNSWIPFEISVILIFAAIFILSYFIIWTIVYLATKSASKRLNAQINK